jgi:hypothetical protein
MAKIDTHIRKALEGEDPAQRLHQILPPDHRYRIGLADAVRFERRYIDLKVSEVPIRWQQQYRGYIARLQRVELGTKTHQKTHHARK